MITVDVDVAEPAWHETGPIEEWCRRAVEAAIAVAAPHLFRWRVEVSLLLADDETVARLNRDWRGKPEPTDVLSFPAGAPSAGAAPEADLPWLLGDLALAHGVVTRAAAAHGRPVAHHLAHLVVHGVLHLLGHDHEDEDEARTMAALETAALARLGMPDPHRAAADA
ncbi:MAG: rRNA maturation RNase YbeY [Sphingomonadaceae bacterium]|uniref:rRNA maturation RNase YbeY n=1 Tax=Thermaurantiacus sp. TaxID=2820283 RepID=UPI00298ED793|nr:rRNA maturation RNase YbeY [Thermaurantiacus sp.]MCS6985914.1 rRNA maturation RNase YbeY [Sphingomonadaceae bacterium]MDW8414870.1 rRNA maturation RNase YbeY [Thermaurantiacus sp.]